MTARADDLVVFLGPSLGARAARQIAPCTVLPPARQGDLWRALARRPRAIALVDGVFESVPSIWHHEILAALDAGVAVFGGASMGALRAAELWREGMVGVGRIFEGYRDGRLVDDSEVALLHAGAEHGWQGFTVPLVNLRHDAERALGAGLLSAREARAFVRAAAAIHFQERTRERLAGLAPAGLARLAPEDLKALDARATVAAAAASLAGPPRPASTGGAGPSSLVRRRRLWEEPGFAALRRLPDAAALAREGTRTLLLAGWARELGLRASPAERAEAEAAWWRSQRVPAARRAAHLARLGLDAGSAARLWEILALEAKVLADAARMLSDGPGADEALAFEARRRGLWPVAEEAAPRRRASRSRPRR